MKKFIKNNLLHLIIFFSISILLFINVYDLFFYDEDIFVINQKSDYMSHLWERLLILKLSFKINYFFSHKNPVGYHLANVLIHLLNGYTSLFILKKAIHDIKDYLTEFQYKFIPYIFIILFLLSPIHSEPICYILGRCGSIASLFSLLSILLFIKSQQRSNIFLLFSLICFFTAMLAYEISWMVPVMILCISIGMNLLNKSPFLKGLLSVLPFFLTLISWLFIKTHFIDQQVLSEYDQSEVFTRGIKTFLKNDVILFLRNYIPPLENSIYFLITSIVFVFVLITGLLYIFKNNRPIFYLLSLLIILSILAYLPATPFGINSHNSESERYVYLSSAFAIMFLSIFISNLIKNKKKLIITFTSITTIYAYTLLKTINYYQQAGVLSKKYLEAIYKASNNAENILLINQPSQLHGALIFRAPTRLYSNNINLSIINEYMQFLYNEKSKYFTLLSKEMNINFKNFIIIFLKKDILKQYLLSNYKKVEINYESAGKSIYENNIVIWLKRDSLLIFR